MGVDPATLQSELKAAAEAANPDLSYVLPDGRTVSDALDRLWESIATAIQPYLPRVSVIRVASGAGAPTGSAVSVFDSGSYNLGVFTTDLDGVTHEPAPGTLTVAEPGRYLIHLIVPLRASSLTDPVMCYLRVNGVAVAETEQIAPVANRTFQVATQWVADLEAGDTIEAFVEPNAGNMTLRSGATMTISKVG